MVNIYFRSELGFLFEHKTGTVLCCLQYIFVLRFGGVCVMLVMLRLFLVVSLCLCDITVEGEVVVVVTSYLDEKPRLDGKFQILNMRAEADPWNYTVCWRFQSYHFNTSSVNVYQCLVSNGASCLIESIHGQSCKSTDSNCSKGRHQSKLYIFQIIVISIKILRLISSPEEKTNIRI